MAARNLQLKAENFIPLVENLQGTHDWNNTVTVRNPTSRTRPGLGTRVLVRVDRVAQLAEAAETWAEVAAGAEGGGKGGRGGKEEQPVGACCGKACCSQAMAAPQQHYHLA